VLFRSPKPQNPKTQNVSLLVIIKMSQKLARPPASKHFALDNDAVKGPYKVDEYKQYPEFKDAHFINQNCALLATSFNELMVLRLLKEKPDYLEEHNISKAELVTHLTNNMCLREQKYFSKVFRDTTAQLRSKRYLNDEMRRLSNGGDRFHPYL